MSFTIILSASNMQGFTLELDGVQRRRQIWRKKGESLDMVMETYGDKEFEGSLKIRRQHCTILTNRSETSALSD